MNAWLENLKRQVLADKKKLGVMIVLAVFGLLLWGRLLLKDVPRTASAEPEASIQTDGSPDNATSFSRNDSRVEIVEIRSSHRISRNLFWCDLNRYNRIFTPTDDEKFLGQDNSPPQPSDDKVNAEDVLNDARRLTLRSVMSGPQSRAVINDRLIKPGDPIEGFVLQAVARRYVLLERDGVVIRLWM